MQTDRASLRMPSAPHYFASSLSAGNILSKLVRHPEMAHLFKPPGAQEESRDFNRQFRVMKNTADLYYRELPYNGNYARHVMAGCESMRHGRSLAVRKDAFLSSSNIGPKGSVMWPSPILIGKIDVRRCPRRRGLQCRSVEIFHSCAVDCSDLMQGDCGLVDCLEGTTLEFSLIVSHRLCP
jgi:hypothetical protein